MHQDGTIELFQYWNRLRGDRAAPTRTEVEPADIRRLLADTFILELDATGAASFRLAGTRLCAAYGRELKGVGFDELWRGRDQAVVARLVRCASDDQSVVVVTFAGSTARERTLDFEMLLVPLAGSTPGPRLLGVIQPAKRPYWLGADPIVVNRLDSLRVVDPDREPLFLANRPPIPVPPLAPEPDAIVPAASRPRRIRHLLVLDGGRREDD